jgi:hypothetical protein
MTPTTTEAWRGKRTPETEMVERALRNAFPNADAYRYNSASIRVRVIDKRFEGVPIEKRDELIEEYLAELPERTQADIISLFLFAPSELEELSPKTLRQHFSNNDFEEPSPSML